jgi:4-aminobutyrate aminotransferase
VTNTGHCHPDVISAAQEQLGKLVHGQINLVFHQPMFDLVSELLEVAPPHLDRFFFSNSGAEAVEASIKLARQVTGRPNIIVFQGGYHGRTVGTMSLTTSNTAYRLGYQPLMAGVFVAPFPYSYYYGWPPEVTTAFCLRQLRHLLTTQTAPQETAAILVEAVLGEGGYVVPPPDFLPGVEEICRANDILLIVDEVQTGFGRTGRFFAHEHYQIEPDIISMAKGMASGMPLSGIAARGEVMDEWIQGTHGGTYCANPVCCAAAAATIRVIREEHLVENSAEMGSFLLERLRAIAERFPAIGDVRGLGLMAATEFTSSDGQPDSETVLAVLQQCLEDGLILLICGTYKNVIRWIPPLIVDKAQLDEGLHIFEGALEKVLGAPD